MSEIHKGERVRCWPGSKQGRHWLAEVISDGLVEFGGTKCYRIRKDDGGTDYIAATHVKSLKDFELGQRVRFTTHLRRGWGGEANTRGSNKVWEPLPIIGKLTPPREGIIIGKRTLSNGWYAYGGYEDPGIYTAKEHFQAWMVVTDLRSAPVHVLPEHITPIEGDSHVQ